MSIMGYTKAGADAKRRTRTDLRTRRRLHESIVNPDVTLITGAASIIPAATQSIPFTTATLTPALIPANYAMVDWGQAQLQTPAIYNNGNPGGFIYHREPWGFQQGKTIRFYTDATDVSVMGYYGINGYSKVWVDGQPAATNNLIAWGGNNINVLYLSIQFSSYKARLIEIKTDNYLYSVNINPTAQMWAPEPLQGPRILAVGDSLVQGAYASGNFGAFQMLDDLMALPNIAIDGQGGSSYNANGAYYGSGTDGSGSFRNPARLANGIAWNPDVVIIGSALNDFNSTPQRTVAQVQADMVALFTSWRNALPSATLISMRCVLTPVFRSAQGSTIPAMVASLDAALDAGLLASLGVKVMPKASGIFTGTGNQGVPLGDGNSDRYVYVDGAHPNDAGSQYLARHYSEALLSILEA